MNRLKPQKKTLTNTLNATALQKTKLKPFILITGPLRNRLKRQKEMILMTPDRTIPLANPFVFNGTDYTHLRTTRYVSNGALALVLQDDEYFPYHEIVLTVNLDCRPDKDTQVYINTNSAVVSVLLPHLVEQGLLTETTEPSIDTGFIPYPTYDTHLTEKEVRT